MFKIFKTKEKQKEKEKVKEFHQCNPIFNNHNVKFDKYDAVGELRKTMRNDIFSDYEKYEKEKK